MPTKKSSAEKAEVKDKDVWMVLLCGLPGSGKSTLRKRMVSLGWQYVSQDEMGSMEECGKKIVKAIKAGQSCVVDRCNVTSSERRLCMQFGTRAIEKGEVKGIKLHFEAVWMATPPDVCKARAAAREGHETLSPEKAAEVVDQFCNGLKVPQRSGQEPYDAVLSVANTQDETVVLQRYANPANIDSGSLTAVPTATSKVSAPLPNVALDASLPAELFVVRHGERADRAKHRDDGWPDDSLLTKEGQETAKRAGSALRTLSTSPVAVVYSSPFCRCLQTADQIAAELNVPVRVEPGLSELFSVFDQAPRLRSSSESLGRALQRVAVDCSLPPIMTALPSWPEEPRDSNKRVLSVAKALANRHAGEPIVLVCHAHSLIEITRHLPTEGGGMAGSRCGYCAMSHISQAGAVQRCLDLTYLSASADHESIGRYDCSSITPAVGVWTDAWDWIDPDTLLSISLDDVLAKYPSFRAAFQRGSHQQQQRWVDGWVAPDVEMRQKLLAALSNGMFECSD
jgi:broad specificity phosphatase PhoE/predicted kinase